jgi:hypothetical protein
VILAAASPSIVAAIIAAVASLVVAIVTAVFTRRQSIALKELEAAQAEDNARIAYNYEARKRLYAVCEPLLFQAMEQAEDARSRICSLAKAARTGNLMADGAGWLARSDGYYFKSTVYSLLAPITTFSILQRRLTTIDLGLDETVRAKYEMLKLVFFSFSKDWEIAEYGGDSGKLEYDRNRTDPGEPGREELLRDSPQRYAPQGLYRGMIYVVAEALISKAGESAKGSDPALAPERCMTFGEFQREWDRAESELSSPVASAPDRLPFQSRTQSAMVPVFDSLVELFADFHPERKPVLWRVLLSQHLLYRALSGDKPILAPLMEKEIESFDWRVDAASTADYRKPLSIAEGFVDGELAALRGHLGQ